jgi:secreted PhoX family phosphatase
VATPLEALFARQQPGASPHGAIPGYGPLAAVRDEATGLPLLELPPGFRYISAGWTGDPLDDGGRTPGAHDGMAAFRWRNNRVRIIRNHEMTAGPTFASALAYDEAAGGGTTTLEFDVARGAWVGARASLAGTIRNCAGGPTPWGSWLTCEETLLEPKVDQPFKKVHGYIFEVPLDRAPSREPLKAMGRFVHEAVAVDPKTGIVYETEDRGSAGLYRFTPRTRGALRDGGRLEILAIDGRPRFDTRPGQPAGAEYPVAWVPIDDPDRAHEDPVKADGGGVFAQGWAEGGAVFARLEGAWHDAGKIYVTATSGGTAKMGQVWELDPARSVLRLVYESPGADILDMPDNLCASPRGGLVLCEDGTATPSIHGLSTDGRIFRFARNNILLNGETRGLTGDYRSSEFAGATFSPDGQWLFVNVQSPGLTFAITGPWGKGLL